MLPFRPATRPLAPALLGAAILGAAAIANAVVARRSEKRHPPTGKFVTVGGMRLHYLDKGEDRGAGPPIVLLHGNGAMAEDFAVSGLPDLLAENHRVIAFDRPGFGHSPRPRGRPWTPERQAALLLQALDTMGVERPVIAGHSWGASVALAMALARPDTVAGLGLMSGYFVPTPRLDAPLVAGPAVPVLGDILRYTVAPPIGWLQAGAVFRKLFAPNAVLRRFLKGFPTGLSLRPSQIRAFAAESALLIPAAARLLPRAKILRMPVLILAGIQDRVVEFDAHSKALHQAMPGSTLVGIPEVGHMVHHIATRQVAEAIAALAARASR